MCAMREKSWRSTMLGGTKRLLRMWQARPKTYECQVRNPQSAYRPQHQGKVFTMDVEAAEKSKDLI